MPCHTYTCCRVVRPRVPELPQPLSLKVLYPHLIYVLMDILHRSRQTIAGIGSSYLCRPTSGGTSRHFDRSGRCTSHFWVIQILAKVSECRCISNGDALPCSLDFASSNFPCSHKEVRVLDRWCQAEKLEKLASILREVYANSADSGLAMGMLASTYRL